MCLPVTTIQSVVLSAVFLSSCQTDANRTTDASSRMTAPEARAIAGDMTARLSEVVPPQKTAVAAPSDGSVLSLELAQSLKSAGYAINPGTEANARPILKLSYSTFQQDGVWMAQVSVPSVTLSRAYVSDEAGAQPASPLSILRH